MDGDYAAKCERLAARLDRFERVAIAFSGGVDSSVLLHAANERLGERALGVIADSPSLPRSELADALRFASAIGARLEVIETRELEDPRYSANRGDRCYFCKSALFDAMAAWTRERGFATLAFGEIADDLAVERPGRRAAHEFGVAAPLADAGFTKDDVRRWAREHSLDVADKPASACLASRIPVGTLVTRERLARVEAAESELRTLGFIVLRVRDHGRRALVEVGRGELARAERSRSTIAERLGAIGFDELELGVYLTPLEKLAQR